jgi:hypothetical protein
VFFLADIARQPSSSDSNIIKAHTRQALFPPIKRPVAADLDPPVQIGIFLPVGNGFVGC